MEIRKMEEKDFDGCMELIKEFYDEALHEYSPNVNSSFVRQLCEKWKDSSFVAEADDKVVGVLGGEFITDLLNNEKTYAEIIWFMSAPYRKYGIKLLHYVEDWVKQQGSTRMVLCHLGNSKSDKLFDFYTRIGYTAIETHYVKQLNP